MLLFVKLEVRDPDFSGRRIGSAFVWRFRGAFPPVLAAVLSIAGCKAGVVATSVGTTGMGGGGGVPASTGSGGSGASASTTGIAGTTSSVDQGTGGSTAIADGGTDASCSQLNIAILGNPGSNPSSDFQAWLEARGTTVQRIQTTTDVPLTAETLQPFDVVILDFLARDYTTSEAAVFAAWVSAGGGVVALSGYQNDPSQDWRAKPLLAPLGVAYATNNGQQVWGPVTDFATHPITVGLSSITFTGGYAVSDVGGSTSTRTPIAFVPNNVGNIPVAYAVQMDAGRAFVWGDEWIEYDSEWAAMPQIPQLWLQVFNWISPPQRCMLTGIMIGAVLPASHPASGRPSR
jgi:hypothetical protein